ncbi:MAG: hypothetical protein K6G05_02065 [Lachnospiraceae bacterium]|nr:hypothetical protein [Lachnospiraceae bacterium]
MTMNDTEDRDVSLEQNSISGEDMLLEQVDAFREKARQIQALVNAKERKVKELEAMVRAKEDQNARLQASLEEKQKEADSIVADVNVQVDRLLSDVKMNMANLEGQIKQQIRNNEGAAAEQSQEVKNTLAQMLKGLDGIKGDLGDKVHDENVKVYRNIQDLMKEMDRSEDQEEKSTLLESKVSTLHTQNIILTIFSMFNMALTAVVILVLLGII